MWYGFKNIRFRQPRRYPPELTFINGLCFLNIDHGIAWNPLGREFSVPGKGEGWTWALGCNESLLFDYIDDLWSKNILPIFFSSSPYHSSTESVMNEMIQDLKFDPLMVIGLLPVTIIQWIKEKNIPLTFLTPNSISIQFTLSIPSGYLDVDKGFELSDIGIDPIPYLISIFKEFRGLLILVGQPCCGKTTLASELNKNGFISIDENTAGAIRRGQEKSVNLLKNYMRKLKENEFLGIVIDSSNPTLDHRLKYIDLAKEEEVPYMVGWITRPGFHWNEKRSLPIPKNILNLYSSRLNPPTFDENVVRII